MQALRFTSLNQLARLAGGPVILVLLPIFLSIEEQGYWFTMISFTAFVAFADMGLSTALIQSAAHEYAKIQQCVSQNSNEVARYRIRLNALRLFAWRRAISVAFVVLPLVSSVGFYMLSGQGTSQSIHWEAPWFMLCVTSAGSLVLTIILAYHEGCNDVARIQRARTVVALLNVAVLALGLGTGLRLWSLPLAAGVSTVVGFLFLWRRDRERKIERLSVSSTEIRFGLESWSKEISPLLAKYAASWIGGYAMFQLFTPIVFSLEGATAAGRVGLTISVFTSIFALSNVWSTYQLPHFSIAIALRDRRALDKCITVALKGAVLTYGTLVLVAIAVYMALRQYTHLQERFLGIENVGALVVVWLLQLVIHNLAVYLRAFKEDPLVWHTMVAAAHTVTATLLTLQLLGLDYLFTGVLSVYFWFVPAALVLFIRKRDTTKCWPEVTNR